MNEETKENIARTLETLGRALENAVNSHLMKVEHASSVWKKALKDSHFDSPLTVGKKIIIKDKKK